MKKVILIGAGAQATVITGVLSRASDVSEILVTDIDEVRAKELAEVNGSEKVSAEKIDASDIDAMAARMKAGGFDLVVNATIPMFVHQVMKASLSAGIDYIDMASNEIYPKPDIPVEQFFYADEWEKAGLMCLTGGGGDPGVSRPPGPLRDLGHREAGVRGGPDDRPRAPGPHPGPLGPAGGGRRHQPAPPPRRLPWWE